MAFWEFLIQKEGDRSWLPLESPKVEILEGRYRIVARSSRINAPVEIRMVQNATHETPPVRRIQKRTSQTNKDGLVVIIPFTRLVPGEWELRCTGDLMAEMLGEGWQHGVQLQVLPLESTSDDWDPDWQEDSTDLTDSAAQAQTSQAQAAQENADQTQPDQTQPDQTQPDQTQPDQTQSDGMPIADTIAVQDATDLLLEAQAAATAAAEDSDSPDFGQLAAATLAHSLHLSLERQTYVVLREQPLLLQGQVQPQAEQEPPDRAFAGGHLRLRLFDPQTSQMLVDETQPLAEQALPVPFSLTVALPPKCETHLLLGELALYGMAVAGSLPVVLATQSFSVTTDLLELLEALANDFPAEPPPEPTPAKHRVSNTVSTLPKMAPVQFRPVTQPALPPLLRPSEPAKGRRSLDLPMFNLPAAVDTDQGSGLVNDPAADQGAALAHPPAAAPAPPAAPADQQVASSGLPAQSVDIPELTDISAITEETPSPELATASRVDRLPAPPLSDPESSPESSEREDAETARAAELVMEERSPYVPLDDFVDPSVDWENVERLQPLWQRTATVSGKLTSIPEDRTPEDRTPEDSAFRALKLQDRFLERLQALASDTELAEWLHALETPHPADASPDSSADAPSKSIEAAGIFAKRSQVRPIGRDAELAAQEIVVDDEPAHPEEAAIASSSLATLIEEPLPTPQLEVPTGELIAGQTVTVSVKLPATDARVYAKLWTHDRQSRTLLDGPHWLMDFTPDGLGHVISKTPIMVPFGCVEVQFEAIAIEMTSQRESDKVTVIRSVIPPNLSSVPLDELSG